MNRPIEPFTLTVPVDRTDHVLGPETARVVVVEYGDFECPSCRQAFPAVRQLLRHFEHRVRRRGAASGQLVTRSLKRKAEPA
jgi:protein-disulfide isomerase